MLGLEGYGSGTDDDDEDVGDNATRGRVTLVTDDAHPAEARAPSPPPPAKPTDVPNFAAALPPPKVTTGSLFASLPAPGAGAKGAKRVVAFRPPLRTDALGEDSDEDEADEAKRQGNEKTRRGGDGGDGAGARPAPRTLASLLPKPTRVSEHSSVLGGGFLTGLTGGAAVDLGGPQNAPSLDETTRERSYDDALDQNADDADQNVPHPSRMYATNERGEYLHNANHHNQSDDQSYQSYQAAYQSQKSSFDVDGALAAALAAERGRGRGARFAVRETDAASLRGEGGAGGFVNPASVLGEEHREKLAREAGAKPSAAHKSKNQIGSLLYEAKQAELKILEGRLAGASHKAAAKRKYGW